MTIVAKNSFTLSNVNDGTVTHTAYAYSADGTDRFTTVYPNLNLLEGTKDFSGTWINLDSNKWITDGTYKNLVVKKRTAQWQGCFKIFTAPTDGIYTFSAYVKASGTTTNIYRYGRVNEIDVPNKKIGSNFDWLVDTVSVTLKAGQTAYFRYEISTTNADAILWTAGHKWELGSTATPYMQSASEVTDNDYPRYRGEYSDFSSTASTDPTKYSWGLIRGNTSYSHTAYSWSADGKDGFTTVYPNLNLSTDTKLFTDGKTASPSKKGQVVVNGNATVTSLAGFNYATFTSQGSQNQDWLRVFLIPDTGTPLMDKTEVLPNTKYTFSFFAKGTGTHRIIAYKDWAVAPNNFMDIILTSDWKLYTLTVTSMATIPTNNVQFFFRSSTAGSVISVMKLKVEQGSTATPYMPSSSEIKTSDYPNYIGTYSDSNVESSLDYSKYQWAIFKGQNSNAYTAYSWSSDGTDRFSTVYPNLNLLDGTKDFSGDWSQLSGWVTDGTYKGVTVKKRVGAGSGFYKVWTAPTDGIYTFSSYLKSSGNGGTIRRWVNKNWSDTQPTTIDFDTNFDWKIDTFSISLKAGDIAFVRYEITSDGTDLNIWNAGHKWELGAIATPYMPSESEAQDQWQDAIPMYVGLGEKDSQNPSDYRWQLNPRYVQASSDSGLSNKAGIDDLASVADTANDALVKAQNAVSNEDYTSWLEHDYQSTINNLQDVSAQNQKDIKNVDDRTTIVEGFYGEMKVKWNFIDESFSFSEEGMFISNAQSKMSIQITSDKIVFWDNNVDVAFITGEVLNIQKGVFLESATIGNHLITKFSDDSPVTIIRYVGGIT